MDDRTSVEPVYDIDVSTYDWSVRVFRHLKKLLKVRAELHGDPDWVEQGHIFLFNHFARFETFIPHYLFHEARQVYCVSVASREFFEEEGLLSGFLRGVGVMPNNDRRLLPRLAEQILRGRKVVMFPEGGMVKDRRVLDPSGRYEVYSRTGMDRRKHHTGAAVLALGLDIFKAAVRSADRRGQRQRLAGWVDALGLPNRDALVEAARRPTLIVPANITFYPLIRIDEHILTRLAERLGRDLSDRHSEELLIEGNILLRETDMDIQLGHPIRSDSFWRPWERWIIEGLAERIQSPEDAYLATRHPLRWDEKLVAQGLHRSAALVRDRYMRAMYQVVTVNLNHLASTLILLCLRNHRTEIGLDRFYRVLYLTVHYIRVLPKVHLHEGLRDPDACRGLPDGEHPGLGEFLATAAKAGLVEIGPDTLRLLPKLLAEHALDTIRIENPVAVYANEIAPLIRVVRAVRRALTDVDALRPVDAAALRFEDEVAAWRRERPLAGPPNLAAASGPFLLKPPLATGGGVLLIHALLSGPAELRGFAERLSGSGVHVLAVRLKGHATSPEDLARWRYEDWLADVRRGYRILGAHAGRIDVVGAGAGGLLALWLAAEQPEGLASVAALAPPWQFAADAPIAPLRHSHPILVRWAARRAGGSCVDWPPEHPEFAYAGVPLRALAELRRLMDALEPRLKEVRCPAFLAQAEADPLLAPDSTRRLGQLLSSRDRVILDIPGARHSLLADDLGGVQARLIEFLKKERQPAVPGDRPFSILPEPAG
jgi:esterase/lipase/1-acyl-sn-glycerol-3-phosphate acyltransferase